MSGILLTTYQGKILGPIAKWILGPIINVIFTFLDWCLGHFDSGLVGITIIVFTIVVYTLIMPLTIKQQKFSKLSAKMNPELNAIRDRYKGKNDNDSMMAMQAETKAVYAKYGVSPSGSCVQLLITMPIFFALYRVIYSLPAYIPVIKSRFEVLAQSAISNGFVEEIKTLKSSAQYVKNFDIEGNQLNAVIDCLNSMNVDTLTKYAGNTPDCLEALEKIKTYNYFLGMNLSNSPLDMIKQSWNNPSGITWGILIAAALIPILAGVTQWLNVKLMPQQDTSASGDKNETAESMAQSMKMMNNVMPLMSIFFCFTFSAGVGIYWIAGSVIRSIQQVIINKQIDKIDIEEVIKKNEEKRRKKLEKAGLDPNKVDKYANMSTKYLGNNTPAQNKVSMSQKAMVKPVSKKSQDSALNEAMEEMNTAAPKKYAEGSIAAKANLVSQYNNRNNNK